MIVLGEALRLPGLVDEVSMEELIGELVEANREVKRMNAALRGMRAELVAQVGAPPGRRVVLDDCVAEMSFRLVIKVVEL